MTILTNFGTLLYILLPCIEIAWIKDIIDSTVLISLTRVFHKFEISNTEKSGSFFFNNVQMSTIPTLDKKV